MNTSCRSEIGITVGLIDALVAISRTLVDRDWSHPEVQEALADIRDDDDLKRIMDIGDLSAAKDYIAQQRKELDVLLEAVRALTERLPCGS